VITFEHVKKTYPKQLRSQAHKALSGVSFHLEQGATLGLIGPNGAGKSTSIKLLLDFIRLDTGSIKLFGENPALPQSRKKVGYLPEQPSFPLNLSCLELLYFAGRSNGMDDKAILASSEKWLTKLDLWSSRHRLLSGFSKGMRQRASFAMALIHDPELLILDEPMSGLDPIGRAKIVALIQELQRQGKSILFCSHLLDDVERLAEQVVLLYHGRVLFSGDVQSFCQNDESVEDAFLRYIEVEHD